METLKDLAILLAMVVFPLVGYRWGALRIGRQAIETEMYRSPAFDLRGRQAVVAGQRVIVIGRSVIYIGVGFAWIAILFLLF
jgi:hypothetical protein